MSLTYEEYLNLIPEDTKNYVKRVLQYIDIRWSVEVGGYSMANANDVVVCMTCSLLAAWENNETRGKLSACGCRVGNIQFIEDILKELTAEKEKELFERYSSLFLTFSDKSQYYSQSMYDILKEIMYKSCEYSLGSLFGVNDYSCKYIKSYADTLKKGKTEEIEAELYKDLPVDVVFYLEYASKIRAELLKLFKRYSIVEDKYIKNNDSYLVPLSLFYTLFELDTTEVKDILVYFNGKGITRDAVKKLVRIPVASEVEKNNANLECIKYLYKPYFEAKDGEDINVKTIVKRLLDRNITNNISVERILSSLNVSAQDLSNMDEEIDKYKEIERNRQIREFYDGLNVDTRDYINFATKIYQLLLEKMKEGKHNKYILSGEDDVDTLALYIASSFYNTNVEKFYAGYGVSLDKVLKLLNITITKEEIDSQELDSRITMDRFARFVNDGVNASKKSSAITIDNVAMNFCNREFNKSMVMEHIFEGIRRDIDLPEDFTSRVCSYLNKLDRDRRNKLIEIIFKDKSNEYYNFMELVYKVYDAMNRTIRGKEHDDIENIKLAILYAVLYTNHEDSKIYKYVGITINSIDDWYERRIDEYLDGKLDINVVISKLMPFVTEENGKIKVKIFTKENKDMKTVRFLAGLNINYDDLCDLDKVREKIKAKEQRKLLRKQTDGYFAKLDIVSKNIVVDAVRVYEYLVNNKRGIVEQLSDSDIEDLSLFLGLIEGYVSEDIVDSKCGKVYRSNDEYVSKYNITYERVLELLGYSVDELNSNKDLNYDIFMKHFKKYCDGKKTKITKNDLIRTLFGKDSSVVRKIVESFCVDYTVYKAEFIYDKDYIDTLSMEERIIILTELKAYELEPDSTTDIVNYGSELGIHTKYINSEFPETIKQVERNSSVDSIKEVIDKIYGRKTDTSKKHSWFDRIFGTGEQEEHSIDINEEVLEELKRKVIEHINPLYQDIKTFEDLVRYMEVYRKKNLEYLDKVNDAIEYYRIRMNEIDKDDVLETLKIDVYLKALNAKRDSFVLTDQLLRNYIYSLYVLIKGDLTTITGLEMARDTLIPLIGASNIMNNGIDNQRMGIKVNKYIAKLLESVVSKNNVGMRDNLEELRKLGVSDNQLLEISTDVNKYIEQITSSRELSVGEWQEIPVPQSEDIDNSKGYTRKENIKYKSIIYFK